MCARGCPAFAGHLAKARRTGPNRAGARTVGRQASGASLDSAPDDPWAVLGLDAPRSAAERPALPAIRHAFRAAARRAHPDAEGGSEEAFKLVVSAYDAIVNGNTGTKSSKRATRDEAPSWRAQWDKMDEATYLGDWISFDQIERSTDDDGWGEREPLANHFVTQHDATMEGMVGEGDVAIYRLSQAVHGKSWGVGQVEAMQVRYSAHGPNGILYLTPLMASPVFRAGCVCLMADGCAEIASVRVIDRFEVLGEGLDLLADGTVAVVSGSHAYARLVASGMVHIAQCASEDACDVPAEECSYDYD